MHFIQSCYLGRAAGVTINRHQAFKFHNYTGSYREALHTCWVAPCCHPAHALLGIALILLALPFYCCSRQAYEGLSKFQLLLRWVCKRHSPGMILKTHPEALQHHAYQAYLREGLSTKPPSFLRYFFRTAIIAFLMGRAQMCLIRFSSEWKDHMGERLFALEHNIGFIFNTVVIFHHLIKHQCLIKSITFQWASCGSQFQ